MSRDRIEPAPAFMVDGQRCQSETVYCYAGARVLELATALPDLGVHVETVYVTASGEVTQVTDLMTAQGEEILAVRRLSDFPICGEVAGVRCVRDHAERVAAFLESLGLREPCCDIGVGQPEIAIALRHRARRLP
jgi:hypothetical protein